MSIDKDDYGEIIPQSDEELIWFNPVKLKVVITVKWLLVVMGGKNKEVGGFYSPLMVDSLMLFPYKINIVDFGWYSIG